MNKNSILTNNGYGNNQNKQPTIITNTLSSKNDLRNTKSKMKTNTITGTLGGLGDLEALGSKIVGPKISVIKR